MKLQCIKGFADSDNINVICLQGDVITINEVAEGSISCEGEYGWCAGFELALTPERIAECFRVFKDN